MKSNELVSGAGLNFSCTGLSEDGVLHLAVMDKDIKLTPKQISFIRDKELRIGDAYVGRLRVSNKQEGARAYTEAQDIVTRLGYLLENENACSMFGVKLKSGLKII